MHWFNRPETRYTAPTERQSPFARASQEWDNRIGSARVQAHHWRIMAFAAMGLSAVLTVCLTWLGAQSSVLTYIVELEKTGQPGRIQLATQPLPAVYASDRLPHPQDGRAGAKRPVRSRGPEAKLARSLQVPHRRRRGEDERAGRGPRRSRLWASPNPIGPGHQRDPPKRPVVPGALGRDDVR